MHRIGRTGRAGKSGVAYTFFGDQDKALAASLVNVLKEAGQKVPEAIFKYPMFTKKKQHKLYGSHGPNKDLIGTKCKKMTFDDSDDESDDD